MGPAHAVGPLGWRAEQVVIYITHQTGHDCELYKERKKVCGRSQELQGHGGGLYGHLMATQ
jgi:hypothetical protein